MRVYYASFLRKTFKKKQGNSNPSSHKNKKNKLKDNKESTFKHNNNIEYNKIIIQ